MNIKVRSVFGEAFVNVLSECDSSTRVIVYPCVEKIELAPWLDKDVRRSYRELCANRNIVCDIYVNPRRDKVLRYCLKLKIPILFICGCSHTVKEQNRKKEYSDVNCLGVQLESIILGDYI